MATGSVCEDREQVTPNIQEPEKSACILPCPSATSPVCATADDEAAPPVHPEIVLQKWNDPKVNVYRIFVTFYSFIVVGMNDAAVGVSSLCAARNPQAPLSSSSGAWLTTGIGFDTICRISLSPSSAQPFDL
jgi:hypothetical protein